MFLSLSEAASLPLEIEVKWADGTTETLSLPRLTMADFAPWLDELAEKYRKVILANITKTTKPADAAALQAYAARQFATMEDLKEPVAKAEGCERVIRLSCQKAGLDEAKANQLIAMIGPFDRFSLAMGLSTLWAVPATQAKPETNANPSQPATANPDAGESLSSSL